MSPAIVACATPFGVGAVSVVRVSGAGVPELVRRVCGRLPPPRRASLVRLRDEAGVFDEGLVVFFPGPGSYTGEDLAEVSCHGNPLLVDRLVRAFVTAGARLASPGEFTRRALLSGRLDLPRAEAVLDLLTATSERGLELARATLDGALGEAVEGLRARVVDVAAELEAILDYPGEDLLFRTDAELSAALASVAADARALLAAAPSARVAVEGARVALVGPVNAGKSSLLNALAGRTRALVSPTPGTTRDVVEVAVQLRAARVVLVDTAGERDFPEALEAEGLALGRAAAAEADLRLLVVPLHLPWDPAWDALRAGLRAPVLVVGTHGDLPRRAEGPVDVVVSSPRREGLDALVTAILACLGVAGDAAEGAPLSAGAALTTRRQEAGLRAFLAAVDEAHGALGDGPAVVVDALYRAVGAVDALLGRDTREDVLDRLFARFCVGK